MTAAEHHKTPRLLLAGDIGATKTNLAVFPEDGSFRIPLVEATFQSRDYAGLEAVAKEFLPRIGTRVDRAYFGVAGPVISGRAAITNLPWVLNERRLQKRLDITNVTLLNDLEAIAAAVPLLEKEDLFVLNPGNPVAGGPKAVIAPGTGLGEAYLTWNGNRYLAHASEGGHTDFGPESSEQSDLLAFMRKRFDHISYERVCSGHGIPHLYAFFKAGGQYREPEALAEQIKLAEDPTPIIIEHALDSDPSHEIYRVVLKMFISILGAEAGNLALKIMATGGVFLGGGIPPRILPVFKREWFMEAFQRKGRMSSIMSDIPVSIITTPKAALMGAAYIGSTRAKEQ